MGVALLNVYSVHVMNNIHTIDTVQWHPIIVLCKRLQMLMVYSQLHMQML